MPTKIDLSKLPEVVNPAFYPLLFVEDRFLVLMGGAGSGKSYFTAQKWLTRAVQERHSIIALRKVGKTVSDSLWRLFRSIISDWNWESLFTFNKTEKRIICVNGSEILCAGLDEPEKIKSIHGVTGIWIEEATEFTQGDLDQLNLRLRGETDTYKQITLTFNPISVRHWLKRYFWDNPKENAHVHHSTAKDNKHIDPEYYSILEGMKRDNPAMYRVYALGQWGVLKGLIYTPPTVVPAAEWPVRDSFTEIIYGLDFGWNDPTVLMEYGIQAARFVDQTDAPIWEREVLYKTEMTTSELRKALPQLIKNTAHKSKYAFPIYADSAEPDRIEEISRDGWNIIPAHKEQNSIRKGIDFCMGLNLMIHEDSANAVEEYYSYAWKQSAEGNPLDEPVDSNNHAQDAKRYALYSHFGKNASSAEAVVAASLGQLVGEGAY